MSLPEYASYKNSGVEWLGKVPSHWDIAPIKTVASCNEDVLTESTPEDFEIEYVEISDVDASLGIVGTTHVDFGSAPSRARRLVKDGDVLVSTVRTYLRAIAPVAHAAVNLIASTGFAVIRPRSVYSGFLGYALRGEYFVSQVIARSTGISYPAINASELTRLKIPLPPHPEQTQITAFLDRETNKIDSLITAEQELIELLKEKRQALIPGSGVKNAFSGLNGFQSGGLGEYRFCEVLYHR
jgi:type I restriction enzyme, S subunit